MEGRLFQRAVFDRLKVEIFADRTAIGLAAAERVGTWMRRITARKGGLTMMFAAASSQREFLLALGAIEDLDWSRVAALQMDEYGGMRVRSRQTLAAFLAEYLYDVVHPGTVHYLDGTTTDLRAECRRYASVLARHPVDILCAGIGENGHLAFNEPPADLNDPEFIKVVDLDERSRQQQIHDGQFASLDQVPTRALTVTISALMRARYVSCVVPGPTKAEAVRATLQNPVSPMCPASILRRHPRAVLYLDRDAAALLTSSPAPSA